MARRNRTRYLDDGTPYRVCDCLEPALHISREQWKQGMREAFALLSPQSRWQRFASGSASLTEAQLNYLTDVDGCSRGACCAVIPDPQRIRGIGIARYIRLDDDPQHAEFAVTVIDRYQGQGVGRALMRHLVADARRNGIDTLVGNVLPSNSGMLALCRTLGATISHEEEFVRVCLSIG